MSCSIKQRVLKIVKVVYIIIALLYFTTMSSNDNPEIFLNGYTRLERLLKGDVYGYFFDWSHCLPYGVLLQLSLSIWAVPIKLINIIFKASIENTIGAYIWYKLPIAILFYFCVEETEKLGIAVGINKTKMQYVGLFTATSLLAFIPIFHIAQIDVAYLIFMIYGVRKYIEEDYKSFIIAFMIANPVKYLSIFIFIPLVLLKEKRILYIIRDLFRGLILVILELIVKNFTNIFVTVGAVSSEVVTTPSTLTTSQNRALLFNIFTGPDGMDASVVVVAFCIVCLIAYIWGLSANKEKKTIWISFSAVAVLFTFGTAHCQWIILMVPFLIVLIFMNQYDFKVNVILEIVMQISFVGVYVLSQSEVIGGSRTFDTLLFSLNEYLMNRRASHSTNNVILFLMDEFSYPGEFERVLPALAVFSVMSILVINLPQIRNNSNNRLEDKEFEVISISAIVIRLIILVLWFLINFYCLFK